MIDPQAFVRSALIAQDELSLFVDNATSHIEDYKRKGGNIAKLHQEVGKIKADSPESAGVRAILLHIINGC